MSITPRELIHNAILGKDEEKVQTEFLRRFGHEIESFETAMTELYDRFRDFDTRFSKTEETATVTALLFSILYGHLVSMRLLISGHLIPAGNIERQVIESIAMWILSSRIDWPYLKKYMQGQFSTDRSVSILLKRSGELGLNKKALLQIQKAFQFFHKLSHPTRLALAHMIALDGTGNYYLVSGFDKSKVFGYKKEIHLRLSLAISLLSAFALVSGNMSKW